MINDRDRHIAEFVDIIKTRYNASLHEIIDAYSGEITIPATIYDSELTPLETTVSFLFSEKHFNEDKIAALLHRPKSTVTNSLRNATKKSVSVHEDHSSVRIPVSAFTQELSPAEAVVHALHEQGLRNVEIARLLGRDQRNIWQLLNRAKKRGDGHE